MADFAEWLPTDAVLASGEDATTFHNAYPVAYQALNKELFDELAAEDGIERLFFVRSAYLGSQPLVSVVWAGDQQTDFTPGDGYPSVIPMGIGLGVTGFPYFGHDIGGYMSQLTDPTTKELWFRWVTLGALSPVMRTHHGKSAEENWNWESDAESTTHLARWAGLHQQLFPYLWALAHDAADTGMPMMRPLALAYPGFEPGWTATDQFMLGDRLIVAPVVTEGATSRTVALPPGQYYPLLGGEVVDVQAGDAPVEVTASITEIPVLVPAGTILVLLPEGVDTVVAAAAGSGVTTLADVADDREVWLWPGGDSRFTEAGGLSYAWSAADLTGNPESATWNGAPVTFTAGVAEVEGAGVLAVGSATLEVTGGAADRRLRIRIQSSL
jgi:alpha-glucosidase (family GH31 glycosyl hydrolase)